MTLVEHGYTAKSQRASDLRTASDIGWGVVDFCGLLVAFALFLALMGGCAEPREHVRLELPLLVYLCDAMPAADRAAWGRAAAELNAPHGPGAYLVGVGNGPAWDCGAELCPSAQSSVTRDHEGCVVRLSYPMGAADDVAATELEQLVAGAL